MSGLSWGRFLIAQKGWAIHRLAIVFNILVAVYKLGEFLLVDSDPHALVWGLTPLYHWVLLGNVWFLLYHNLALLELYYWWGVDCLCWFRD